MRRRNNINFYPMKDQKCAWHKLTIDQKIKVKQHAINKHGKRTHYNRPDAFKGLTETQLYYLLATKN